VSAHDSIVKEFEMRKVMTAGVLVLTLCVGACNTPEERAVGGGLLGAGAGALIGGAAGGGRGAAVGAVVGGATGAVVGAATAPCPYGTYRDYYGNVYCR
jgi:osmotically inducible lipoprotein OsmB